MENDQRSPTRVMRIITQLHISGPALQAVVLTSRLNAMGYDNILVCGSSSSTEDSMSAIARQYEIEPVIIPTLARSVNPFTTVRSMWNLVRLMRKFKPDVVHTHATTAGIIGRIAARISGVPVVIHTLHFHPFRGYYSALHTRMFTLGERLGAAFSDSIITLSEGLRKELVENYHVTRKNRIIVLPIGFDLNIFASTKRNLGHFRQQWQIAGDAVVVGIIGRLLPVKNHGLFLEAAARVRERIPNSVFVIVGDGPERTMLEARVQELGLAGAVIFTGWQQQVEIIYSDLDVLVNSSHNEGTPLPLIEALAAGCPVVATRVGGIPDLLNAGELGELVPADNPQALCEAIVRTVQHPPDLKSAQHTMLHRYGIDRLAEDLDSLYRGLLAKKRGRSEIN